MGTHIDAFFPRAVEGTETDLLRRLQVLFGRLKEELDVIQTRGRFSRGAGPWWLTKGESWVLSGEGPCGFMICVGAQVIEFTSIERFGALYDSRYGLIQEPLRRVFEAAAQELGGGHELAVAEGGFGGTDIAGERAAEGAGFEEVCGGLEEVLGPAARSWEELEQEQGRWYRRERGGER